MPDKKQTSLFTLLQVISVGEDLFQGIQPDLDAQRVFGGQLLGQALVAASETVEAGIHPHSTHARFLRAPSPKEPISYQVFRMRDGSSYFNREVRAEQSMGTVLTMSISFHRSESGLEHSTTMPVVPDPETLQPFNIQIAPYADRLSQWFQRPRPIEVRYIGHPPWEAAERGETVDQSQVWMRAEKLDTDSPAIHAAALIYASDMVILDAAVMRHGLGWFPEKVRAASLDHGMWFHNQSRADSWILYDQECLWTGNGRALATGSMYSQDGRRAATVIQEAVLRQPR